MLMPCLSILYFDNLRSPEGTIVDTILSLSEKQESELGKVS
jgi:hypothetical protein